MADKFFQVVGDGDEVGAVLARAGLARQVAVPPHVQVRPGLMQFSRPDWMGSPDIPQGVTAPEEELDPLPFVAIDLTTSGTDPLIAKPQRPFRGERLVMAATYITAAGVASDASSFTVINGAIYVGATQIGAAQGQTPISAYAATAFGVRLSWPRAGQGTEINIPVRYLGTIAAGDKVTVTAVVFGRAVR